MKNKIVYIILLAATVTCCNEFISVGPPRTELVRATVFDNVATAEAAIASIYSQLRSGGFASGNTNSISYYGALSSDEVIHFRTSFVEHTDQINENRILPSNTLISGLWSDLYSVIYKTNSIIEGLEASRSIAESSKKELMGEAKFFRAFAHFYLVNLWGDVPLITSSDYESNRFAVRANSSVVYNQIVSDLLDAQQYLPMQRPDEERVRVRKDAVNLFLARVYLYLGEWSKAELEATRMLDNSLVYQLEPDPAHVFNKTSKEVVFQLWNNTFPLDRGTWNVSGTTPTSAILRSEFASVVEPGDKRWQSWVQNREGSMGEFQFVLKYADLSSPPQQYSTVLRLAEAYLIRAEARIRQSNISGGKDDINVIRERAGLDPVNFTETYDLLQSIEKERMFEFINEWGHRWLDLKRTGRADQILTAIKPDWSSDDQLYPIPESQLLLSPLSQNPGY